MKKFTAILIAAVICLAACIFIAGCTDSSTTDTPAESASVPVTATTASALFRTGDIVKNPSSSSPIAVLIIKYDAAADSYERAYIYPNSDGSWGYRTDSSTLTISRVNLEKLYSQKLSNVVVSSIPTAAPTTIATIATTTATTSTTTAVTTATLAAPPKISSIDPDRGTAATTVSGFIVTGRNFVTGANVSLKKGSTYIPATSINVKSSSEISCNIVIPAGTDGGNWDVVVTNLDKQSDAYETSFYIVESSVTATSTTSSSSSSSSGLVKIIQIQNTNIPNGGVDWYGQISILGTNLTAANNMRLVGTNTYTGTNYACGTGSASAFFSIPATSTGTYHITVVDSSGTILATSPDTVTVSMS